MCTCGCTHIIIPSILRVNGDDGVPKPECVIAATCMIIYNSEYFWKMCNESRACHKIMARIILF